MAGHVQTQLADTDTSTYDTGDRSDVPNFKSRVRIRTVAGRELPYIEGSQLA